MIFTNIDYFIIVLSLLSGLVFIFLGLEKLHKFYFGVIIGFLFFIVANLYIKALQSPECFKMSVPPDSSFLLLNKSFILGFLSLFIPIFGISLTVSEFISFKVYDNKIGSFVFGSLVPYFLLSIFSYINTNAIVLISYVSDIFDILSNISNISFYLEKNSYLSLYILVFLVSFRITFWLFISFTIYIINEVKKGTKKDKGN
ncbi:hypothetical protein EOM39_01440 [Candidatus Gracilibacteria bacterium]|nr:hypothetical protein [Candidatus Gracilibacteria bacterium]